MGKKTLFVVTDIRTVEDESAVLITSTQHSTRNSADSQYYTKVAAAARSTYPTHAVILTDNFGSYYDSKFYEHEQETNDEGGVTGP